MIFMYVCIILFTVAQSVAVKLYNRKGNSVLPFNAVKAISACLLFAVMNLTRFTFHTGTAVYGTLYGLLLAISMYSGYKALSIGPMSLTSLIVSFSVIIPLIFGVFCFDEHLNTFNIIGFVLLIVAIIFVNLTKPQTADTGKSSLKWMLFVAATFVSNGICSVLQKSHQVAFRSMYCSEFMLYTMVVCSLIFLVMCLAKTHNKENHFGLCEVKYGTLSGISNAVAGYLTTRLAGFENASVLFPAISAGTILCTLAAGVLLFKEKLRYNHFVAIFAGIAAVVFFKL